MTVHPQAGETCTGCGKYIHGAHTCPPGAPIEGATMLTIIKREPALITGALQALLSALVGCGIIHLSTTQTGAVLAVAAAALGLVTAATTRPFHVSALTGLVAAGVPLLLAFGVKHVSSADIATINTVITTLTALLVRVHVTPKAAPASVPVSPPVAPPGAP